MIKYKLLLIILIASAFSIYLAACYLFVKIAMARRQQRISCFPRQLRWEEIHLLHPPSGTLVVIKNPDTLWYCPAIDPAQISVIHVQAYGYLICNPPTLSIPELRLLHPCIPIIMLNWGYLTSTNVVK